MNERGTLTGAVVVISGGSRGIGEAIATRVAADGARVALLAKTLDPHPSLPGTLRSAAAAVEAAGGTALPIVCDVRDETQIAAAIGRVRETFGRIDVVVNNASAIDLSDSSQLELKKFDLMMDVNVRGAFVLTTECVPDLRLAPNPHVLTLSPPITTDPKWFVGHSAYTISKFGMSLLTLGLAGELKEAGIAVNSLWPRTAIDTAAVRNVVSPGMHRRTRTTAIMADAAYEVITARSSECTGQMLIDDQVLRAAGVSDFSKYLNGGTEEELLLDMWVSPEGVNDKREGLLV